VTNRLRTSTTGEKRRRRGGPARGLQDLRLPAGNRLESLKGARAGYFSIRANEQYRITFRFEKGKADDVACEDYH